MKIIIEEKASREDEDTIIVRCASLNESILKLLQQLKAGDELITCTQNGTIARIRPDDVYYFESVDNKTFLYTEKEVYEIRQKLYEIEDSWLQMIICHRMALLSSEFFQKILIKTAAPITVHVVIAENVNISSFKIRISYLPICSAALSVRLHIVLIS